VRYTRVIPPVALLATLSACTDHSPSFNPTPAPTRPGQVVTIVGSPENYDPPRDGEYAVRSSAQSEGGLAVDSSSGAIYLRVVSGSDKPVERVERDGTLTVLHPENPGDQLGLTPGTLWIMSSYKGVRLSKMSLSGLAETEMLNTGRGHEVEVLDPSGDPLDVRKRERLREAWADSRFVVRGDGVPVIVSRVGRLYEVAGPGMVREWNPTGYAEALGNLTKGADLRPTSAVAVGPDGLLILAPSGLLRIGDGRARDIRIHMLSQGLPQWSAAIPLDDGSTLLLGGTSALEPEPRPGLVRPDGKLEILTYGKRRRCEEFDGSMGVLASSDPVGTGRMNNGDFIVADQTCGRVYRVRPPRHSAGVPHTR
jgi:hypothetical protein